MFVILIHSSFHSSGLNLASLLINPCHVFCPKFLNSQKSMDYHNKRVAFLVHSYMLCIHSLLRLIEESCYDSYCISYNLQISHYTPFAGKILNYSELSRRIRDKFSYCLDTATDRNDVFFSSNCKWFILLARILFPLFCRFTQLKLFLWQRPRVRSSCHV